MDFSFLRAKAYVDTSSEENGKGAQIYQKKDPANAVTYDLHCLTPKVKVGFCRVGLTGFRRWASWPRAGMLTAPERDPVS